MNWMIIVGFLLSSLGTFMIWYGQKNETDIETKKVEKRDSAILKLNQDLTKKTEELNSQLLGGNTTPLLEITTTKTNDKIPYFILWFDLRNKGEYPIHFTRVSIVDITSYYMDKNGINQTRYGMYTSSSAPRVVTKETFNPEVKTDIGTIAAGDKSPVLTTTYSNEIPEYKGANEFSHPIEVRWISGSFSCILKFRIDGDKLVSLPPLMFKVNGKNSDEYDKFINIHSN